MPDPSPAQRLADLGAWLASEARRLVELARTALLGSVVGVLAGVAAAAFLESLDWATKTRTNHPAMLFALPAAGFLVGLTYHYGGKGSHAGNNLILDEIHEPRKWIPRRMAPLVYLGTIATHLFGGSAGREGTAIQMSGSLTDAFNRMFRLSPSDRRLLLVAAIGGGFGAVFGVPVAGLVFGLEVQAVGRIRYDAIVPTMAASLVGDRVVRGLGVHHGFYPTVAEVHLTAGLIGKVALAGVAFGLTGIAFAKATHGVKDLLARWIAWPPARPLLGGCVVVALTLAIGDRSYLGLSLPLVTKALAGGAGVALGAFALKLVFTAITLGSGFQGGEVTPLFVIGGTLGATLGHLLGLPVHLAAALGFVAVFAGATNTPLACTVMGIELFGSGPTLLLALACVVSYACSGQGGIYTSQRKPGATPAPAPGPLLG